VRKWVQQKSREYWLNEKEKVMTDRNIRREARVPEGAQEWLGMLQTLAQQIQKQ
jgi:hypothetical protein